MNILEKLDKALEDILIAKPDNENEESCERKYTSNFCFSKVMDKILELGWNIVEKKKYKECSYLEAEEEYLCTHNGWSFLVSKIADMDIEQGVWRTSNVSKNGKEVDFSVDIGCKNSGVAKLERFCRLLECDSVDEFYEKEYSKYLDIKGEYIPGFLFTLSEYTPEKPRIIIDVAKKDNPENKACLIVYQGWMDDIRVVLTTDKHWDVNSYGTSLSNEISYYIDDISNLEKIINAFFLHMNGEIGYKLDDGSYFNNRSIRTFVERLKDATSKESLNGNKVKYEILNIWDYRGYTEDVRSKYPVPNKSDGIEVSAVINVSFNDTMSWTHGRSHFCYTFVILYDKNRDADNMSVRFVMYDSQLGAYEYKSQEDEYDLYDGKLLIWDAVNPIIDEEQFGSPETIKSFIINTIKAAAKRLEFGFDDEIANKE